MTRLPAVPRALVDRRAAPRIKVLIDVEVDPTCEGTYVWARGTAINAGGLFVQTARPESVGTACGCGSPTRIGATSGVTVALEGVVAWCNPPGPTVDRSRHGGALRRIASWC
jgi:hypothetical protein